jgi:hypothetical protein
MKDPSAAPRPVGVLALHASVLAVCLLMTRRMGETAPIPLKAWCAWGVFLFIAAAAQMGRERYLVARAGRRERLGACPRCGYAGGCKLCPECGPAPRSTGSACGRYLLPLTMGWCLAALTLPFVRCGYQTHGVVRRSRVVATTSGPIHVRMEAEYALRISWFELWQAAAEISYPDQPAADVVVVTLERDGAPNTVRRIPRPIAPGGELLPALARDLDVPQADAHAVDRSLRFDLTSDVNGEFGLSLHGLEAGLCAWSVPVAGHALFIGTSVLLFRRRARILQS